MRSAAANGLDSRAWVRMPAFLQLIVPFAYYVALLLTLGRLHAEQEMVVLQGGGAGTGTMLRWLGPSLVLVTLFLFVLLFTYFLR